MTIMKLISLIFILAILSNCNEMDRQDDKISISKRPYYGNNLRLDGYYYRELNDYITVYYLYRNGSILYSSTFPANELGRHEIQYRSREWQIQIKKMKHRWGLFNIDGNNILFERWYPSEPPLKVLTREGVILNDTTFKISKLYRMIDGNIIDLEAIDEIYKFKPSIAKPDSTNIFTN